MDINVNCFICEKPFDTLPTVLIKQKAINTLVSCSKTLNDNKFIIFSNQTELTVHKKCRDDYTYSAKRASNSVQPSNTRSSLRGTDTYDFENLCLFCENPWQSKIKLTKYKVRSDDMLQRLRETAEARDDEYGGRILTRLSGIDSLVEVNARYHKECFDKFKVVQRKESTGIRKELEDSLQSVYNFLENNSDCQFTVSELLEVMSYKPAEITLLSHLKKKYGENVIIYNTNDGKIICFCGVSKKTLDDTWYMHREEEENAENIRIIKIAAELVRKQIRGTKYNNQSYPSAVNFLESVSDDIPEYLKIFLDEILLFDANVKQRKRIATVKRKSKVSGDSVTTDESLRDDVSSTGTTSTMETDENFSGSHDSVIKDIKTKIEHIGLSIVQAMRPKSFSSRLHLATGIYLNRKCGSKTIINVLAKLGICASYHSVALHEISAIKSDTTKIEPNAFLQYVFDNADHNPSTLDGLNSFHCMGGICCVTPSSALTTAGEVVKLKRLPIAQEIAEEERINLEILPMGKFSLESIIFFDVNALKFGDFSTEIPVTYSTHIWGSYSQVKNLPEIRGFMEKVSSSEPYVVSRIQYLPFIEENPSDLRTVYTSLLYAAKHAREVNQKTVFVTFDYPLYMKALQIVTNSKNKELENVVPRAGGFHSLMSYFKAVGTIMEGSGLRELWGTVYATNSIDKMLQCTSFARALRAHITTAHVIGELIAEFSESVENIESHTNIEGIKNNVETSSMEAPPSTDEIIEIIKNKKIKIQRILEDFSTNPPTLSNLNEDEDLNAMKNLLNSAIQVLKQRGPTAELWLQYFNFILLAIRYIEAERLGNWNLHLYCVQQMLPVYHAAGHSNYVRAMQIYLQQMSTLQDKMDPNEYRLFTEEGHFTVRRTDKAWAGIWTDMTIEQMLMRTIHTGAQGLSHGRGMTSSVMTRFLKGMPYAIEIMNQLEDYVNIKWESSDQHVDLTPARQKRDTSDKDIFKAWLRAHNPFIRSPKLQSLSTGLVGDANTDCHKAISKGLASMASMIGFNAENYKYSKSNTVQTLVSTGPTVDLDGETKTVNTALLFQRIAAVMMNDPSTIKNSLLFELAPFPMTLFNDKGIMREPKKSELYDCLTPSPFNLSDLTGCIYVVDGGFLLHKVLWKEKTKFIDIIADYKSFIFSHYSSTTTIVFDGYDEEFQNVKSYERFRRVTKKTAPEITFEVDMKLTQKKDVFLSNIKNKSRFITKLKSILVAETNINIKQAKEDADTLIVQTAIDLARRNPDKKIVVVGTDVDLATLIIGLTPDHLNISMWKPRASSKQVDVIYESQKNKHLKHSILFAHAFTGCDTVSAIFGKGKKKLLDLIIKKNELMQDVEQFYNSCATAENIQKAGERLMLSLYGQFTPDVTASQCRVTQFMEVIKKSKKAINLATLPPTSAATSLHSFRTYYQVQQWLGNQLDPEQWGWMKTETMYLPVRTTEKLAPENLLKLVHCTCTSDCSNRCGCRKAGLPCSSFCKHCKGEHCGNGDKQIVDDNDEKSYDANKEDSDSSDQYSHYALFIEKFVESLNQEQEEGTSTTSQAVNEEITEETENDEPPPQKRAKNNPKITKK